MPKVIVKSGDNYATLHSDFLVSKESSKRRRSGQLISFTLIGYESDVKKVLKKRGGLEIRVEDGGETKKYNLKNIKNYEIEKQKGSGLHTRYIITRKIEKMLKVSDEGKENRSYPILAIHPNNQHMLDDLAYRYVKSQVTFGMMNVVTEPILMARELMVDVQLAKKVLDVINQTSDEKVPRVLLGRAKKLLKWYGEWKKYLYDEMLKHQLIRKLDVVFTYYPVQMYEIIVDGEKIKQIISKGLSSKKIVFTDSSENKERYEQFDEYMPAFAQPIKHVITNISEPKHKNGDIRKQTKEFFSLLKRKPLDGQIDPMEAGLKSLKEKGKVNFVGECGTGSAERSTITAA